MLYKTHSLSENYSVNCTHLEDKMKAFTALFFLGAFAAYVFANEMTFHRAVKNFLDERHDERMSQVARDHGLPEPDTYVARDHEEPPAFMKPCIEKGEKCWKQADEPCKKLACIDDFFKCFKERAPTGLPELTDLEKGCVALLKLCRRQSPSCAGELCCFVRVNKCFKMASNE